NLAADLAPNATATFSVSVTAPNTTGNLVLEYQMVKEQQFWFGQFSDVNVSVAPLWAASYSVASTPTTWTTGQTQTYTVSVTNTGTQTWPAGGPNPVHLVVHFANAGGGFGANSWYTDQRFNLTADLAPNTTATFSASITAPNTTGNLVLEYRMVKEQQFWFGQFSDVNAFPARPSADRYSVASTPTTWTSGQTQTYTVS